MEARADEPDFKLTVSAPTNRDAADISRAIRREMQGMGAIGEDRAVIRVAMRGQKELQPLALAPGDKVRLFNKVIVERQHFASNGDTVTVLDANTDAMRVRRDDGKEASIKYDQLRARRNEPVALAHGYAVTIDAVQGATTKGEHINAMPDGSRSLTSRKANVAESRNRDTTWTVTNEAAERRQIASRLPIGERIRPEDVWRNLGDNLGRMGISETATQFLRTGSNIRRGAVMALPAASVAAEQREQQGRPAPVFEHAQDLHQAQRVGWLHQAMERMQQTMQHVREVARERLRAMAWERHTPRHEHQAHREVPRQAHGMTMGR
jgi:hypothetical protein